MKKSKSMYMETTRITVDKTSQEISILLARAGARAVLTEYDQNRKISALCFKMEVKGESIPFVLPVRVDPIFKHLQKKLSLRCRNRKEKELQSQAERVAWRQIFRWIEAQIALIETGMVKSDEVFMPYIQTGINETLYEKFAVKSFSQLCISEHIA
jgi:hypothetical protein